MRIRQIKPEFFSDSDMAQLPYAVRLFYIGLWCVADDAGWIEWRPERIAHDLFGYEARARREKHVAEWSSALVKSEHLKVLDCGCAVIPSLPKHQRVTGKQNFLYRDAHGKHQVSGRSAVGKHPIAPERSGSGSGNGTERNVVVGAQAREGEDGGTTGLKATLGEYEQMLGSAAHPTEQVPTPTPEPVDDWAGET